MASRMILAPQFVQLSPVWVPVAIAVCWAGASWIAADLGVMAYAAPLFAAVVFAGGMVFLKAIHGRHGAIAFLVAFVIVALSLSFRKRDLGDVGLDLQNALKLATWIMLLAIAVARWRCIAPLLREPMLALAFVYAMIAFASTAWSEVPAYTGATALGLFAYLGFGCVLIIDLDENLAIRIMMWTLLAFVVVGVIGGIAVPEVTWQPPSVTETRVRLQGFSGLPNSFGQQAGVFLLLAVIAHRKGLVGRAEFLGMLLLGSATVLAAGSRTTFIAVSLAWGLVAARNSRFGGVVAFTLLGGLSLVLVLAACDALPDITGVFGKLSRTGRESEILTLTGRTEIWHVAWTKFQERPLLGWGFNGTEALLLDSFEKSFDGTPVNAHNMYLQGLLSLGFLGSLPAFAYLLLLFTRFVTRPDPTRDLIVVFVLIEGLAEAIIFCSPELVFVVFSWVVAREAAKLLPVAGSSFEPAVEGEAHASVGLANWEPRRS
jgi:O-antigen ligase